MVMATQSFFRFRNFHDHYCLREAIGGTFTQTRRAVDKSTGEHVIVQILPLDSQNDTFDMIYAMTQVVGHPHIISIKEIFEWRGRFLVVMEMTTGDELFDRIVKREKYTEDETRSVMGMILDAVHFMHSRGLVHRDLKLENILYKSNEPDAPIKITGFSLAKISLGEPLFTMCGSPQYVAPEVLRGQGRGYTAQCDMWSVGVILYCLLAGYPPFYHDNPAKLFKSVISGKYSFDSPWWDPVSPEAKDLVSQLLIVDPSCRLSPEQAMKHPFFTGAPS